MSIKKVNDKYVVDIRVDGKRIRRTTKSKTEAKLVEAKLRTAPPKEARRFDEALLRWLKEIQNHKSYNNLKNKARLVRKAMGNPYLSKSHTAAQKATLSWQEENLKPATINRRLAIIRRILKLCYASWDWIDEPLAQKVHLLSEKNERHIYLSQEQAKHLIACADKQVVKDAIALALSTGMRQGELLKLKPEQCFEDRIVLGAETKTGKPRIIPLPPHIAKLDLPLKITYSTLRTGFERAREKAGLPELHFHDLRHTYASWVIKTAKDPTIVRDILGHSNLAVTSRYTHLVDDHLSTAVSETFSKMDTFVDT